MSFHLAICNFLPVPLVLSPSSAGICAADVFASRHPPEASIGRFWSPPDAAGDFAKAKWFSIQLVPSDLLTWLQGTKESGLQGVIASLEAVAQLVLAVLRAQCSGLLTSGLCRLQFAQLCDNASVFSSVFKILSMCEPLCFVLQALGFWACRHGFQL